MCINTPKQKLRVDHTMKEHEVKLFLEKKSQHQSLPQSKKLV